MTVSCCFDFYSCLGFLSIKGVICGPHISLGKLGRDGLTVIPNQHPEFLLRLLGGKLEVWALWTGTRSHKKRCGLYRRDSEQAKIRGMYTVPEFWELTPPPVTRELNGAELYLERTSGCCLLMHPRFHTGQCKTARCPKVSLGISQNKMPFQRDSQHLVLFSEESRLSWHSLVLL